MLTEARRQAILDRVQSKSLVSVSELSEELDVSCMTIRRDLRFLERQGALHRVRGGAASLFRVLEPPLLSRKEQNAAEKEAIGQAAAALVADGDAILLDAGTTTPQIARHLRHKQGVIAVTNALNVAQELSRCVGVEVMIVGGKLKKKEQSLVGPLSCRALAQIHVDKLFLSVGGVDLDAGLTDYDLLEAEGKQIMIQSASEVILVCDHTKFGVVSFARVAPLHAVQRIVTDSGIPARYLDALREKNIEVIVCPVDRLSSYELA